MSDSQRSFTLAEAAVVSGLPQKTLDNALVKGLIPAVPDTAKKGDGLRKLSNDQLVWAKLFAGSSVNVPGNMRDKLWVYFISNRKAHTLRTDGFLILDLKGARDAVNEGVRELAQSERAIHRNPEILGGEPVFKGTRIPVQTIASMLKTGVSRKEILEGYPKLNSRLLDLALIWSKAHPRRGRPKRLGSQRLKLKSRRSYPA